MSNNITPENIESIKSFCESNGVNYYDVQLEAIDHIASMVESRWAMFPHEDFSTALNAIKYDVDWHFFKYKNNKKRTGSIFWQTLAHDKIIFGFVITYMLLLMVVAYTSFGKETFNESLFEGAMLLKYVLVVFYIFSGIWIAYKFSRAKYMLSNLYKRKYWQGIVLCFGFSLALMLNIAVFSQFEYNQTVYGVIMSSFYWVISVPIIYRRFIKEIFIAQNKYPKLFSK